MARCMRANPVRFTPSGELRRFAQIWARSSHVLSVKFYCI
jgi:hypothetical protein